MAHGTNLQRNFIFNAVTYKIQWRRKWQPTPVLLPGKFHGWRSLVGYHSWSRKESNTTERLHFLSFYSSFWRGKWQPIPVILPGESQGWRGLVGCSLWGCLVMSDSLQPHRLQPTRLPVHGTLQARTLEWAAISFSKRNYRKKESEVVRSCPTLSDPMDCSPPGSSVHRIFQARVLEWAAISFS